MNASKYNTLFYVYPQDDKQYDLILEVIRNDELRMYEKKR